MSIELLVITSLTETNVPSLLLNLGPENAYLIQPRSSWARHNRCQNAECKLIFLLSGLFRNLNAITVILMYFVLIAQATIKQMTQCRANIEFMTEYEYKYIFEKSNVWSNMICYFLYPVSKPNTQTETFVKGSHGLRL